MILLRNLRGSLLRLDADDDRVEPRQAHERERQQRHERGLRRTGPAAEQLGDRKVENITATGARAVFAGNVGCLMQITRHLKKVAPHVWAAHPVDALWASYSGQMPKELK